MLKAGKLPEAEEQALIALAPSLSLPSINEAEVLPIVSLLQKIAQQRNQPQERENYVKLERALQLMAQGKKYQIADLIPRANRCYKEAFSLAPTLSSALAIMAQQAEEEGRTQEAEGYYQTLNENLLNVEIGRAHV